MQAHIERDKGSTIVGQPVDQDGLVALVAHCEHAWRGALQAPQSLSIGMRCCGRQNKQRCAGCQQASSLAADFCTVLLLCGLLLAAYLCSLLCGLLLAAYACEVLCDLLQSMGKFAALVSGPGTCCTLELMMMMMMVMRLDRPKLST